MDRSSQIFKKSEADDIFYGVDAFNFETLEARARQIVERAKEEAAAQIARAAAEVDKIRADIRGQEFEAARKEGYDKGYAEGRAKGESDGKEQAYSQNYVELKKAVENTT
ncbi:MAG: hypothetical protein KDB07_13505, partial [Planctomycetes bacterium]|nr:hypothetical protein [Planctomycetota bacterium]